MKQLLMPFLSLFTGLTLGVCSFFANDETLSLLTMALAVIFLLLTIGIMSLASNQVQVQKEKTGNNTFSH